MRKRKPEFTVLRGLYALWRYDSYPYVLGGTVTRMDQMGAVETREFGVGRWFKPLKILPIKEGRALRKQFEKLREEFRQAEEKQKDDFIVKAMALCQEPVIVEFLVTRRRKKDT